jgi:hypothetical protein
MKRAFCRPSPVPIDSDINKLIRDGAKRTGLSEAEIIRSGLRRGIPAFVQDTLQAEQRRRKLSWAWLDAFPRASVPAKNCKAFLRHKLNKKYGTFRK